MHSHNWIYTRGRCCIYSVDLDVLSYLRSIPPDTAIFAVSLAVIIAPWVYRWRQRVRRILVRFAWIALGIVIGISLNV